MYYIEVSGNPTQPELESLAGVVEALPQVEKAGLVVRGSISGGRLPTDGDQWKRGDWQLDPAAATGTN